MLKTYIIAVLLGLLFSLGFAPNDLWFISIFSLTCLHYLIQGANKKELFWIGYSFGFGLWSIGISWLYVSIYFYGNLGFIISIFLIVIFIGILSIYSGVSLLLYHYLRSNSKISILFSLPVAWIVIEFLRSILFTGFPWLNIGTSQTDSILINFAPIIGDYGISLIVCIISITILKIIFYKNRQRFISLSLLIIIFLPFYLNFYLLN